MASWFARAPVVAATCWPRAAPRAVIASQSDVSEPAESGVVSQGFPAEFRLRKTDDYSSVFAFRRAYRGRFFNLHYRPNGGDTARLGVVVAKKLAKRAVLRNLVKRIARDLFRHRRATLPAHDLIVRLAAPPKEASRRELRDDLESLLLRLRP